MAAKTPSTLLRERSGSLTMFIATFAAGVGTGDTWASGLGSNVVSYSVCNQPYAAGNTQSPAVLVSNSSGTFTFDWGNGGVATTQNAFIKNVWAKC